MVLLRSVPPPSEGVRHLQAETTAVLDGKGLGAGTLYVAETYVMFWCDEMQENAHDDEDKSSEEDESEGITEIRFVPSNKAASMCECQALHPDPDDEDSDGDFDGDEYDVEEAGV
ncbi:unnamed protein product [Coregonus sp. 'balchen']|nr:unnamed protein product [Coregonus sp. 'balchen']